MQYSLTTSCEEWFPLSVTSSAVLLDNRYQQPAASCYPPERPQLTIVLLRPRPVYRVAVTMLPEKRTLTVPARNIVYSSMKPRLSANGRVVVYLLDCVMRTREMSRDVCVLAEAVICMQRGLR